MGCCCSADEDGESAARKYREAQPAAGPPASSTASVPRVPRPNVRRLPLLAFTSADHFGQMPKARRGHTLALYADYLVLYGGFSTSSQVFSDCRILDLPTGEWMTLPPKGTLPAARCTHTAVVADREMYVYGIHSGECADIYAFGLESEQWTRVTSWGDVPLSRGGHSAVVWDNHLWVFGGETTAAVTNDLYSFSFVSKRWKVVRQANPDFVVMPRRDHTAVVWDDRMFVYGGFNDVNERMDLLQFDFRKSEWSLVEEREPLPPYRGSHSASLWRHCMVVYGGMYENAHRNDLWLLDLTCGQWYELHYARCRADLAQLTPESLTCFTNADNLPDAQHDDGQPVYMADYMRGRVGLIARRAVCQQVCPNPQPFIPETVSQGQPVVPCAVCYHASAVWQDCFYLWGGGDEEVNYSELYCLYLAALSPFFPEQQPRRPTPPPEAPAVKPSLRTGPRPPAPVPQRVTFADDAGTDGPRRPARAARSLPPLAPARPDGEVESGEPRATGVGGGPVRVAHRVTAPRITLDAVDSSPRTHPTETSATDLNLAVSMGSGVGFSVRSEGLKTLIMEVEQDLAREDKLRAAHPGAAGDHASLQGSHHSSPAGSPPKSGRRTSVLVENVEAQPLFPVPDSRRSSLAETPLNAMMRPSKRRESVLSSESPETQRRGTLSPVGVE
eukprot:EG_transcript_5656